MLLGLLGLGGIAAAGDETMPDIALLEYLGSWEESDEDWTLFAEAAAEQAALEEERTGPASEDKEPVETDDES